MKVREPLKRELARGVQVVNRGHVGRSTTAAEEVKSGIGSDRGGWDQGLSPVRHGSERGCRRALVWVAA